MYIDESVKGRCVVPTENNKNKQKQNIKNSEPDLRLVQTEVSNENMIKTGDFIWCNAV